MTRRVRKVSIIDQWSSPSNHSDKSVNKPGDTGQMAKRFFLHHPQGCRSATEEYTTFLVKVFNEPQHDEPKQKTAARRNKIITAAMNLRTLETDESWPF